MLRKRVQSHRRLRRAAVAVYLAISSAVVIGMAALAVDIGMLYQAQAELQRSADAAALAAAGQLASEDIEDPEVAATLAAQEVAQMNAVLRQATGLDARHDVELGQAIYNPATGRYDFQAGGDVFDAVRVTVRRTEDSAGGPIELLFARFLGHETRGLQAQAAAVLVPRDIAVVIDLSNSMDYDSQLRFYDRSDGGYANTRDIWCALDGPEPSRPYIPTDELDSEYAGDTGPTIGAMSNWGAPLLPGSYNASTDSGLWYIRKNYATTDANLLANLAERGYTSQEISALTNESYDRSYGGYFRNRTAAMIGVANWRSGKPGAAFGPGGDGDNKVENNEMIWLPVPPYSVSWDWPDFIDYVQGTSLPSAFRYRYGLKSYTDFLLCSVAQHNQTDNLWATPEQPVRAVKDAVQIMIDVVTRMQSLDHISLEVFATDAQHEVNLTADLQSVADTLYERQAAHYSTCTCHGCGLAQAIAELQSSRARPNAHKVIMLMSDGQANIDEFGRFQNGSQAAHDYAVDEAEQAADLGIRIYTISVGYDADRGLMQELAAIGHGQEFFAAGNPEEYTEQLEMIFRTLGGKRPVALIE